jgi:hypothetical protein
MKQNEGRELLEYTAIALVVSLGVTLILLGVGDYLAHLLQMIVQMSVN